MPGPGQKGGIKYPKGKRKKPTKLRRMPVMRNEGFGSASSLGSIIPPDKPWGGYSGGPVETEDQRSKRMEKEDANVRGYMHGGKVKGYGGGGKVKGKK
jgi:hypothetical protein